jgi:oxidoreductase
MSRAPSTRVAVVGLGWAARHIWLPRLLDHPGYAVTAVVDPDRTARDAAVVPGQVRRASGIEALDPADIDLVVLAAPNHLHADLAERLLHRDLAVFVEKPVCLTSAEADRLAAAERAGSGRLLAGSAARHRADVRQLYALAAELGALRHVEVSWVRSGGVPGAGGWFTDRRRSGGGALVDLGWHLLDVIHPLLGGEGFAQVLGTTSDDFIATGTGAATWRDDRSGGTGDVEDTARGFLITETGVSVALRASWASHERFDVTTLRLDGSAGTAHLSCTFGFSPNRAGGSRLTVTRDGVTDDVALPDEPIGAEYRRQLDEIRTLLAGPSVRGEAVAGAGRTIQVIERLYASARRPPAGRRSEPAPVGR